jgi:P22 tail accessory factor
MPWTKQDLIEAAFEEIGLATYTYDLQPEQIVSAERRLSSLVAEWNSIGIHIGFNLPGDFAEDSGIQERDASAVYTALALRLASSYGKTPSIELRQTAAAAYNALIMRFVVPAQKVMPPNFPLGAGNATRRKYTAETTPGPIGLDDGKTLTFLNA